MKDIFQIKKEVTAFTAVLICKFTTVCTSAPSPCMLLLFGAHDHDESVYGEKTRVSEGQQSPLHSETSFRMLSHFPHHIPQKYYTHSISLWSHMHLCAPADMPLPEESSHEPARLRVCLPLLPFRYYLCGSIGLMRWLNR